MRIPRKLLLGPGSAFHLWWRGHNREHVLSSRPEKSSYLAALANSLRRMSEAPSAPGEPETCAVRIFSFCLMSNHAHLVGCIDEKALDIIPLSRLFQRAHSLFGQWYNGTRRRTGKVAEERFKTRLAENDAALQATTMYGDANSVRAGIVKHPRDYRWSSYRFYAYGEAVCGAEILSPPAWYRALAATPRERQRKYRRLVDAYLRRADLLHDRWTAGEKPAGHFVGAPSFVAARASALRALLASVKAKPPP